MALLKRRRVLGAKIEATVGTAESLTGAEAAYNAYDVMIQPQIEMTEREGQGGFGYLSSTTGAYKGVATFKTYLGWDGSATEPSWADTFLPACGMVKSGQVFYPKTAAPGSDVKTLTIGCYLDDMFKSIKGACGNAKIVLPTGKAAYIDWTFTGVWVPPTDVAILTPTYPTTETVLRGAGGAASFNSVALCYSTCTFDLQNEVYVRECTTDTAGLFAALITNRNPIITVDPEAKLVATRDSYGNLLSRTEATFTTTIAGPSTSTLVIAAPKAQITSIQEGERSRLVTDEITFQCNRNGSTADQEISITFTP